MPFGPEGWTPQRLGDLFGKTYVITGATTGLGFEATKLLISKGAKVVMLNRCPNKSADVMETVRQDFPTSADNLSFVLMDLSDLSSVRKAAAQLLEGGSSPVSTIDALICNAAIAQVPKQKLTKDGFESQLGVNHMGHFLLCGLLSCKVESSRGRIVVVSSLGYKMGLKKINFDDLNFDQKYDANTVYSQSKLAQMIFAYELMRRIQASGKKYPKVLVCHPGCSRTELCKEEIKSQCFTSCVFSCLMRSSLSQTAEKGSWPEVMCAAEEEHLEVGSEDVQEPKLYGPTGSLEFKGPVGVNTLDKEITLDQAAAVRLWSISEEKVGFKWEL